MSQLAEKTGSAKIAGYSILKKISVGSQGAVYKGRDPQTGKDVAVKVLSERMVNDPVLRLRFAQECQVARRLQHSNIVRVIDYGLDGEKPYLVMEFLEGESLGECLDRERRLGEQEAVAIISQIGQALHAAHGCGLIHRDVTPDNILLTHNGVAKLTDLGLVKNLDGEFNLTCTQSVLGTPNFMPPEQFEDAKRVNAQSDLYSLAATLYSALTGELPFRARTQMALGAIYKKKVTNDIAPARQLNQELSERVSDALARALRADPKERHGNVLEFVEALAAPPAPPAAKPLPGARQRRALSAADQDRRDGPRFTVQVGANCQPFEGSPAARWDGTVVNISANGFCLELHRKFEPGAVLTVRLGGRKLGRRTLLARVKWVKKSSSRLWQIGCEHDGALSDQDIKDCS